MEIKILNEDLELIYILEVFQSLRWIRKYNKVGEFELHCLLNIDILNYLAKDNIIYINDDTAGVIEHIELSLDENSQEIIVVKGNFLETYLSRRINWGKIIFNGNIEDLIHQLLLENAIEPENPVRKIPKLCFEKKNIDKNITYQNSYGNILDIIEAITFSNDLGYRIKVDIATKKLTFEIYKGNDRTIKSKSPCIFSRDFENVLNQFYTYNNFNTKNFCLIAGEGQGQERKLAEIGSSSLLNRRELFCDARDIISDSIDINVYENMLKQRGYEKLTDYSEIKTFEGKINLNSNLKYKTDFNLGDVITILDKKWGITLDTMIIEIEEIYEGATKDIIISFGYNSPTLIDKIKMMKR